MAKITAPQTGKTTEQDDLRSLLDKGVAYAQEKPREIGIAAAAVAVIVALAFLVSFLVERSADKRVAAVTEAISAYLDSADDGTEDATAVRERLATVTRKHGNSDMGVQALYFLGGALAREGNYEEATRTYLDVYDKTGARGTLAGAAQLGAAYALAAGGEGERAIEQYRDLLDSGEQAVPRSQIRLEIARLLRSAGDNEGAAMELQKLIEESPEASQAVEARKILSVIEGS